MPAWRPAAAIKSWRWRQALVGVLQVVAQWPSLRAIDYFQVPRIVSPPSVREALGRMGPVLAAWASLHRRGDRATPALGLDVGHRAIGWALRLAIFRKASS
jgi:hypothetical protein